MSTQQLEYLVAVIDAPTWAHAAADLGVSPSALSQGLAQLERRVGVDLFDRDGRRRIFRPEAQPVLDYARTVLTATRDLTRWSGEVRQGRRGQLRIGMIDLAATVHFGATLQRFRAERPDVDLHLAVAPSGPLCDQVRRGLLALAVVVEPPVNTGDLDVEPLLDDVLAIYGPADGGPGRPPDRWGPWVTFPADSHTRHLVFDRLERLGAPTDVVAESHQPEVLRAMVALGMGWTVLPVLQAETEPNPLVRARPEPLMSRQLVAIRRHGGIDDPVVDALLDSLRRRPTAAR